jgi:hypothetical protein
MLYYRRTDRFVPSSRDFDWFDCLSHGTLGNRELREMVETEFGKSKDLPFARHLLVCA